MKKNFNDVNVKDYYIGLDIGTSSVGFSVTDTEYNLKKHNGKGMWGVRIFEEGKTAAERRVNRTNRRRLSRRNQRLALLRLLFDEEITKVDSGFFMRLKESFLSVDDKKSQIKYSLFADSDYTDKDYMKQYATIYHLRDELMDNESPHDIRLVYLACHHIIKNRGHFLFDIDGDVGKGAAACFDELLECLKEIKGIELSISSEEILNIIDKRASKMDRVKEISQKLGLESKEDKKAVEKIFNLIVGGTVKLSDIFGKDSSTKSISFDMGDEKLEEAKQEIGDDFDLIDGAKRLYDAIVLKKITNGYTSISKYKKAEYDLHKKDVAQLKDYVKNVLCDKSLYNEIFVKRSDKLCNYSAYSGYKKGDAECKCTADDFCKYLKSKLPKLPVDESFTEMYRRIDEGIFAPKLRTSENGVVPNGLHRKELVKILENASKYLPFLNQIDEDGISVKGKIISIFDYKIPYYVGPLKGKWAVINSNEKVYPWNFEKVINLEESAQGFIKTMTSLCTYTGDDVLPKDSLLYSEFEVLNEINNLKINTHPITVDTKKKIFEELFVKKNKKNSKKTIFEFLKTEGLVTDEDVISGIDDTIKSSLASYHKMKNIINKTSIELVEEIIKRVVLFGDDKKLLRSWLEKETPLSKDDIAYVTKQKFSGWGRFSRRLLSEIESVNEETGELLTMIQMLREKNVNHMKLLSSEYTFKTQADEYRAEKYGYKGNPREAVDALYVSPKIKRSIWQTIRILDEIIDTQKGAPKKIFIEVARDRNGDNEKVRTKSRKEQLIELYKACKEDASTLFTNLVNESEESLRRDKLFLYYLQFGKCMYSEKPIDLSMLEENGLYDIDHIYPRSKIKDDSIDNRVLIQAELNREKTNEYPIKSEIRKNRLGFWNMLKQRNAISQKKYERLIRDMPLTVDELTAFINRQIVETRQSTKAVAELFKVIYPNTKIVYSKAGNVSDFRKKFDFIKCRDINDHHHAKDAYLNIVVGNYFDTRFTADFKKNILTEEYSLNPKALYNHDVKGAWKSGENGTISTVKAVMKKNNVLFTVMPIEARGQLFDVTLMKKRKGHLVQIKNGLEIEKYGGYNKASGAYFALVEHTEKKKTIRSLEPVLIYQKVEYEHNPQAFAQKHWYENARVILKKVLISSVLELNGVRFNLRGRSMDSLVLSHAIQLVVDSKKEKYIKNALKYIEDCKKAKKEVTPSQSNPITKDENLKVYDYFIEKIKNTIYKSILKNIGEYLENNRERYSKLSLLEQCELLKDALKGFQCNAALPSFSSAIRKPKRLSSNKEAFLINQSVTGIYETKIDLLK
ncbi:MAG: type II CRISPR RNA-guided endonuclease Cas9 [Clostridia bacterium]|nr:type II CRISPR RNA-guided endonuclease Cas9 [Clostridia bacterium]